MELKFIGDRSSILRTIIIPSGKPPAQNDKNAQKNSNNCAKIEIALFLYIFRIYSLNIFEGGRLGAWPHSSSPLATPLRRLGLARL